jgi:small subunit ribosomal protein S16
LVKIRLRRVGAKKKPSYRLVVADSRAPRDGAFIEVIGHYNPLTNPATIVVDSEKALSWLRQGAQPTATASRLLSKAGVTKEAKPPKAAVAEKPEPAKAVKEPKPTKAGATKKPRVAKAGATKKSKPAKEKT